MAELTTIPPDSGTNFSSAELASIGLQGGLVTVGTGANAVTELIVVAQEKAVKVEETAVINMTALGVSKVDIQGAKLKAGIELVATANNDSIVFGNTDSTNQTKTEIKGGTIDLGGGADTFTINKSAVLKKVTVTNFSANDTVVTKKGTFTVEDLNAKGKLKGAGLGGVTFQVTP